LALAHNLQFLCQIERQSGRPREAIGAGGEALTLAKTLCEERPGDRQGWGELAAAYNEYGLALKAGGQLDRAFAVLREGYDRLGGSDALRSTDGVPSAIARQSYARLMIAYNLGHDYSEIKNVGESERWYGNGLELARKLLFVLPDDSQLLYMHGMCCESLIEIGLQSGRPADSLTLHREGLESLEKALPAYAHDNKLRSELGLCWHRYADDMARAGQRGRALAALWRAIAHQAGAVAAAPEASDYRDLLRSHLVRSAELLAYRPSGVAIAPPQIPRAED
jgi:tetratricopeptide (TPR) repeat protein